MTTLTVRRKKLGKKPRLAKPKNSKWPPPAQHVVLYGLSWQDYVQIGSILCDRPSLRLTFSEGTLEIMVTSPEHEIYKTRLGDLIQIMADVFNLDIETRGNMTFQREDVEKGLEGDNCWWIEHEEQVRGKLTWDPVVDPPPDLLLEIEISRTALARMPIYAKLKIPQVWCFDGNSIRVFLLQADGTYLQVNESPTFPGVPLAEVARFAQPQKEKSYLTILREFRTWLTGQLKRKTESRRKGKSK